MYRVIGTLYILAPRLHKSTHTNLSNRNLPFRRPFNFWRPYAEKARITQHFGAHALRLLCVPGGRHQYHWRRRPIAASPQWAPKELKMMLRLFRKGFHSHPNAPKSVGGWGSAPDPSPNSEGERLCACQSDTLKGGAPIPIFAPGAGNSRYATAWVQALMRQKAPNARYIHCAAHALNLVLGCCKNI